jgi:hypothetical protein
MSQISCQFCVCACRAHAFIACACDKIQRDACMYVRRRPVHVSKVSDNIITYHHQFLSRPIRVPKKNTSAAPASPRSRTCRNSASYSVVVRRFEWSAVCLPVGSCETESASQRTAHARDRENERYNRRRAERKRRREGNYDRRTR